MADRENGRQVRKKYVMQGKNKEDGKNLRDGHLIVIEGLDGSGKATQTRLLYESMINEGKNVRKVSFPNYESDSSALIKMYLSGQFGDSPFDVNAYAE